MKKYFLGAIMALSMAGTKATAQMPYNLTVKNETYTALTTGTSINGNVIWDEENYAVPLGFNFDINGKSISKLYMAGASIVATDTSGIVSGFPMLGADLADRGTGGSVSKSPIRYTVTGTSGSRIFKAEVANAGFYDEMDLYSTMNDSVNIQVWLYEGTNVVELHFGPSKISHFNDYFVFDGPMLGFFKNLDLDMGTIEKAYLLRGAPVTPTIDSFTDLFSVKGMSAYPANGTVYRFTPKGNTTFVHSVNAADDIQVYPTECINNLNIANKNTETLTYRIISSTGVEMAQGNIYRESARINVSGYPAGNYLVVVKSSTGNKVYKISKVY